VKLFACSHKRKFDSISSTIRDVLHWLPIQQRVQYKLCTLVLNCLHGVAPVYLSTMCQPVSENLGRRCLRLAARGDLAVPATRAVLRCPWLCCGWTVYIELSANVTARPVINTDILLSPTEDLSVVQSTRFISTLVTVVFITTPYIIT